MTLRDLYNIATQNQADATTLTAALRTLTMRSMHKRINALTPLPSDRPAVAGPTGIDVGLVVSLGSWRISGESEVGTCRRMIQVYAS